MLSTTLKEAIKEAHQQLEKKVVLRMKAIRSDEDYADFLKYFYAYFEKVEQAINPHLNTDLLPDYNDRRTSAYLKKDIEELGFTIDKLPEAKAPEINNVLQALGALYVMEGSIMGGSIIVKMLEKNGITKGVSFFSGYGAATGQKWGVFTAVLNDQAKTQDDETIAVDAANQTFSRFGDVFEESNMHDDKQ